MTVDPTTEHWIELTVRCDAEAVEDVSELFERYGFKRGVVVDEASTQASERDTFTVAPSRLITVRAVLSTGDVTTEELEDTRSVLWVLRQQLWLLGRSRPVGELEIVERQEEDWPNTWKAGYSVVRVGTRVLAKAAWHDHEPQPGEIVVELDPGMAFGTGRHLSTQLCMQALEAELKVGDHVLDVGIGSGLLATAAALLGASAVDGVDIDPVAIRAARETADRNGVGETVRVALGSVGPDGPFPGTFDLVVANIITSVLIELAPALARAVAPGGTLILGGILDDKETFVHDAFAPESLTLVRRAESEDWRALVFRQPE